MGSGTVVVARTPAEIEAIRPSWQTFDLPTVHHDVDFYLAKLRARPAVLRPHAILLERDSRPVAIAIGRLEDRTLACKFGYRTVYRPTMRLLVMRPGLLLVRDRNTSGRQLVAEILASLTRGEADAVSFYGLKSDSNLFRAATELPSAISRGRFVVREPHWKLELPESLDAFLASRSRHARGEIRGVGNRLARKYGARMSTRVFRSLSELDQLFADLERVADKTYQRVLDAAFTDTEERRETTALALSRGWFRAYVLYIDGAPVAYQSGFLYRGTFSGAQTGYDPAFRSDRVGTYLLVRLIEDLCQDDTARVVDFGCGEAEYKRRFSTCGSEEAHPMVFAPTFRGIRVNVISTAIAAADEVAQKALERAGVSGTLKKRLRTASPAGLNR
jgi:hypothetical protein